MTKSKNLVADPYPAAITPQYAQDITRFGDPKQHPPYLTMALGAGSVTPVEMAIGYSVFASGSYRSHPITSLASRMPAVECWPRRRPCARARCARIDSRNAFVMYNIMQDVIRGGTEARAMSLGRTDLAGKTGTTSDQMDAWFAGFQRNLTCVVWMGFDLPRSLGSNETGAVAALPIWISFMGVVLEKLPEYLPPVPEGVVAARVDPETGLRSPASKNTIIEYFYYENLPLEEEPSPETGGQSEPRRREDIKNEIY